MGLPYIIEYLLTLERPGGGRLAHTGVSQTIIPMFPPNTSIVLSTTPLGDDYAFISYYGGWGPTMVPGAFAVWIQQYGTLYYSAIVSNWPYSGLFPLQGFVFSTRSEPTIAGIINITDLNQYYEGLLYFLRIASEEDWVLIREDLVRLGTSAKSEQLAAESNRLLRIMVGEPQPPLEGS